MSLFGFLFKKRGFRMHIMPNHEDKLDFETDSIRFLFEAYMMDYTTSLHTVLSRIELEERTTNYLFILIAAVISAFAIFTEFASQVSDWLERNSFVCLLLALISLLFPLRILQNNLYIASIGRYTQHVLSPKINHIATSLSMHNRSTHELIAWEKKRFPFWARGVFQWQTFAAKDRRSFIWFLSPMLAGFRYAYISLPSVFFLIVFLSIKSTTVPWMGWTLLDQFFFVLLVVFAIVLIIGLVVNAFDYTSAYIPAQKED